MDACSRPYSGVQDSERLRSWLVDARRKRGHSCWHTGDLIWRSFLHSIRYDLGRTLRLWEDGDGRLLGFVIVTPPSETGTVYFDLQVDPELCEHSLVEQMLDWVEGWQSKVPVGPAGDWRACLSTDTGVYDDDLGQAEILQSRGFLRSRSKGFLLHRSLDELIPAPAIAPGFEVRSMDGPHEIEARAAAHRDTFSPSRITGEAYRQLWQTPGYLPEMDLVAVTPNGSFGAFCIAWLDPGNRVGEFEPVGTRPAFRQLGLARAVLCEGMHRMKASGMQAAIVGPIDAENARALGLYQSLGFRPIHELDTWVRGTG